MGFSSWAGKRSVIGYLDKWQGSVLGQAREPHLILGLAREVYKSEVK